jgi:YD repeat-containing protein
MKIKLCLIATLMITGLIRLEAGQIQYSYDENNRVVAVNVNNETAAQYEYDPAHNLSEHDVESKPGGLKSFILYFTKYSGTEKILRWIGLWNTDEVSS